MGKKATGHIRQQKKGLWEGQYVFQQERRSIYGKTRSEVEKELACIVASIERGEYVRPNQHTLKSWLEEWLETYAKPSLRPGTFLNYESIIERHFSSGLGYVRLNTVSTKMLQDFFNEKLQNGRADKKGGGLSVKILKNIKYMLHVAFEQAYFFNLVPFNPIDGVRLPVPDHVEQRVMTANEKNMICDYADTLESLSAKGVIILLTCGLRRGELLGLQWQDIDLINGSMKIKHTVSRLKKFDVSRSAYPYIRIDDYAPESNKTALYLGPVKTSKGIRTIYLPNRAAQVFLAIKEWNDQYMRKNRGLIHTTWCFVQKMGIALTQRRLKKVFIKFSQTWGSSV